MLRSLVQSRNVSVQLKPHHRYFSASQTHALIKIASLPSRRLLRVTGSDSTKFLQGLVSNDIDLLRSQKMIYCALLNAPGRILYDLFIHRLPSSADGKEGYLIEHDASVTAPLSTALKRFILRSKIKLADVSSDFSLHAAFRPLEAVSTPDINEEVNGLAKDPRTASMGYRLLLPSSTSISNLDLIEEVKQVSELEYRLHRTRLGVSEGPEELISGVSIPLESNLDYMSGVDFRKGCYIGQELTSRTHHTGVTRKRILPVRIFPPSEATTPTSLLPSTFLDPIPETSDLGNMDLRPLESEVKKPRPSGKLLSSLKVKEPSTGEEVIIGLALVRLEQMDVGEGVFVGTLSPKEGEGTKEWRVKGFRMDWWEEKKVELGKQKR